MDGLPKEKVLAVVLRLINSLYFRVGTELSEKHYRTYGITTLTKGHLSIKPKGKLVFDFVGKSHVQHRKVLVDDENAPARVALPGIPQNSHAGYQRYGVTADLHHGDLAHEGAFATPDRSPDALLSRFLLPISRSPAGQRGFLVIGGAVAAGTRPEPLLDAGAL